MRKPITARMRKPITARDPILREAFAEADKIGITMAALAKAAGLEHHSITRMRRPHDKRCGVKAESLYRLAEAVGLEIIIRQKREP
jgi:lambda repressor-like predicted transcriptional regulator